MEKKYVFLSDSLLSLLLPQAWCVNTPGEVDGSTHYAFLGGSGSALNCTAAPKYLRKGYQLELSGPNCLWILKKVIEVAQSLDPAVVKKTFENMNEAGKRFVSFGSIWV